MLPPLMPMLVNPVVLTVMVMMVPMMETGAGMRAKRLGASLRDRAFRSNLRSLRSLQFPLQSLAPPLPSVAARSACRGGSLTLPAVAGPAHSRRGSTASPAGPPWSPRAGATRRARRGPRLARPGRLRRLRASPRLVAAALRASPVPASPRTGSGTAPCTNRSTGVFARARAPAERSRTSLRTAPGSRVRMTADTAVAASGSVLRTTACGSGRTARHSIAVAASTGVGRRRPFPDRPVQRESGSVWTPGRALVLTPHAPLVHFRLSPAFA